MVDVSIEETTLRGQLRFSNFSVDSNKVSVARGRREQDWRPADAEIKVPGRLKELTCIENRE